MKIRISDIMPDCASVDIEVNTGDKAMINRIKALSLKKISAEPVKKKRMPLRTLLIAAVLTALLTSTAFALSGYLMNIETVNEDDPMVSGRWVVVDSDGEVLEEQKMVFPDAGMVFTFTGPEQQYNMPELRCFWLPSEADFGYTDEEGWTNYLSDSGEGTELPYIVSVCNVKTGGSRLVLNGKPTVVKEEDWGNWRIIEISSDYNGTYIPWGMANYIILFDAERGYKVTVSGTSDMETLEHIARELEIRESDRPQSTHAYPDTIGCMDIGRG